jgi:hypothetical protein
MEMKPWVSLDRVRRLRVEVPAFAGYIEITSIEDTKGRGWSVPEASIEGPYDGWRMPRGQVPVVMQALTDAFELFDQEFGKGGG